MRMKIRVLLLVVLSVVLAQCNSADKTLIAKNKVGEITKATKFNNIEEIFAKDSIVSLPEGSDEPTSYKIFKEGKLAMIVNKLIDNDTLINQIENVQVFDAAYTTDRKISTNSTYKDVADQYTINKVEPTFTSAILFVDEINATIALNKKDLNIDEFDMRKIDKDQIPDRTAVKTITIWFD